MGEWPPTTHGNPPRQPRHHPGDAGLAREAAAELYAGDPAEFIRRRGELAARARASGDATAARAITSLRKPTRAAWVVNRLVRDDPGAAARLAELGAGLQQAGHALDGGRLRELSQQRRELIAALTRQALAGLPDAPGALQEEVAATLSAAVTDPQVAAELAAGALVRPVERAGFGFGPPAPEDERLLAGAPRASQRSGRLITARSVQPELRRGRHSRASAAPSASAPRGTGPPTPNGPARNANGSSPNANGSSPNANGSAGPSPRRSRPCATRSRQRTRPRPRNGTEPTPSGSASSSWKRPRTTLRRRNANPVRPPVRYGMPAGPSAGSRRVRRADRRLPSGRLCPPLPAPARPPLPARPSLPSPSAPPAVPVRPTRPSPSAPSGRPRLRWVTGPRPRAGFTLRGFTTWCAIEVGACWPGGLPDW